MLGFDDEEYDMDMALQQEDLSHETLGQSSQTHREMLDMQPEEDSLPCVPASDHARVVRDLSLDMEREMCNQYDLDSEDVAVEASSSFSSKCVLPEAITQPSTPPQSNNAHETPLPKKKATSSDSDIKKKTYFHQRWLVVCASGCNDCDWFAVRTTVGILCEAKSGKKSANNYLRTYIYRRLNLVKRGEPIKLSTGITVHCPSAAEYDLNKHRVRKHILYDMAMSGEHSPEVSATAAQKWMEASGESVAPLGGRPRQDSDPAEMVLKSNQLLLTWHGDFGAAQVNVSMVQDMSLTDLEYYLKTIPSVLKAWDVADVYLKNLKERFGLHAIAYALEVCPRTWTEQKILKLHMHGWMLQSHGSQRLTVVDICLPHALKPFRSMYGQDLRSGISIYAGCFYCACEKLGQLFTYTSKEAHIDYQVKADWVLRLYSGNKILYQIARYHLVRQLTNLTQYLKDLEYARMLMEVQEEEIARAKILEAIFKEAKPVREISAIQTWELQYDNDKPLDRYMFLVLDGPSKMGKTRYVQSRLVARPQQALILDCGDAVVPALKGNFCRKTHSLVMFDEAHVAMIIRCKKLFQASVNPTTYGSSATNAFIHTVWMHGIKLVIGSNVWQQELALLPQGDRNWIEENSVYVFVDTPLYIN